MKYVCETVICSYWCTVIHNWNYRKVIKQKAEVIKLLLLTMLVMFCCPTQQFA